MTLAPSDGGMRNAKSIRRTSGKLELWLDAWKSNLAFVAFVVLFGAVLFVVYNGPGLLKLTSPPPIRILMVAEADIHSANRFNRVLVTNSSRRRYNYVFRTEVLKNGSWQSAFVQCSEAGLENVLAPGSDCLLSVPVPEESNVWRVSLAANRVLSGVEAKVDWIFHCLKLQYPFGRGFEVKGPEMVNPSIQATRPAPIKSTPAT
jgi:hypothetical protein